MATRWGTCYFVDIVAARRYYARQGFNARDVDRKIAEKEIHVGELPTVPAGGRRFLDSDERWNVEEPEHWLDPIIKEQQASHAAAGISPAGFAAAAEYSETDEVEDAARV